MADVHDHWPPPDVDDGWPGSARVARLLGKTWLQNFDAVMRHEFRFAQWMLGADTGALPKVARVSVYDRPGRSPRQAFVLHGFLVQGMTARWLGGFAMEDVRRGLLEDYPKATILVEVPDPTSSPRWTGDASSKAAEAAWARRRRHFRRGRGPRAGDRRKWCTKNQSRTDDFSPT